MSWQLLRCMMLFFYVLSMASGENAATTILQLKSIASIFSSNPSEKDKLNSVIDALSKQKSEMQERATLQEKNIIILSDVYNALLLKIKLYADCINNINEKMQSLRHVFDELIKLIINMIEMSKKSKYGILKKLCIYYVRDFFVGWEKLVSSSFNKKGNLYGAMKNGVFDFNFDKEIKKMDKEIGAFEDKNNMLQNQMFETPLILAKDYLKKMNQAGQQISELVKMERNKNITAKEEVFYNFSAAQDFFAQLIFNPIEESERALKEFRILLNHRIFYLNHSKKRMIVVRDAFVNEQNQPGYNIEDFIAGLISKSNNMYIMNNNDKMKILKSLSSSNNEIMSVVNALKSYISKSRERINNKIGMKSQEQSSMLNSLSRLIMLLQEWKGLYFSRIQLQAFVIREESDIGILKTELYKNMINYNKLAKSIKKEIQSNKTEQVVVVNRVNTTKKVQDSILEKTFIPEVHSLVNAIVALPMSSKKKLLREHNNNHVNEIRHKQKANNNIKNETLQHRKRILIGRRKK